MARAPAPGSTAAAGTDGALYQRWLRLRLLHGHLTSAEAIGRHLTLQPTPATAQLLRRLELVALQEAEGCSLLLQGRQRPRLASWLESSGGGPLQWRLLARQGSIWGCTAVPLGARCRQWHLYGSGAEGQSAGELAVRLLAVAERQLTLTPPKTARSLQLLDGRGQRVRELALPAGGTTLVVGIDDLPEGLIQPSFGARRKLEPILHLTPEANAIGLVSLWLPAAAATAESLEFAWPLPGRQTIWHYLLVPRQPQDTLEALRIQGDGCSFSAAPTPETLGDGRRAWRMVGEKALPLLERCPLRFRLEGRRLDGEGQSHRLVVDPLPLAPAEPIWPGRGGDPLVGVSEMVVPV